MVSYHAYMDIRDADLVEFASNSQWGSRNPYLRRVSTIDADSMEDAIEKFFCGRLTPTQVSHIESIGSGRATVRVITKVVPRSRIVKREEKPVKPTVKRRRKKR